MERFPAWRRVAAARLAGAALWAGLLTTVAACQDPTSGPADKAEATVATLLQVCARGEGEAALDLLSPAVRSVFIEAGSTFAGCEAVLELGADSEVLAPQLFSEAVVGSVHVDDGYGTATVTAPDGNTSELELESTGDQWLVSNPQALEAAARTR